MSLSDTDAVLRDEVWLLPKGLEIDAYRAVLMDDRIWRSYYNTIWYTAVGTLFNLVFTVMAAYPAVQADSSSRATSSWSRSW